MNLYGMLGLRELRKPIFYRRLAAEAIGTAILVMFGCGSCVTVTASLAPSVISIAFAFGLSVATVVWSLGSVSGAHINPSVSLAMLATRKISVTRCIAYILVQCVGAVAGAGLLWALTPSNSRGSLGSTLVAADVSVWQGLGVEFICTFILVLTVFSSCDRLRSDHSGPVALSIGLVVTMVVPFAIQYTGGSLNPARSFGPAMVSNSWQDHWIYWIGPIPGGIIAGLMYEYLFDQRHFQTDDDDGDSEDDEIEMKNVKHNDGNNIRSEMPTIQEQPQLRGLHQHHLNQKAFKEEWYGPEARRPSDTKDEKSLIRRRDSKNLPGSSHALSGATKVLLSGKDSNV